MDFFKTKRQTSIHSSFDSLDRSDDEEVSFGERRLSRTKLVVVAKEGLYERRRSSEGNITDVTKLKTRGLFRRRTWNRGHMNRRHKQRMKYTLLRNELDGSQESLKSAAETRDCSTSFRQENRRMATCEQLERLTRAGPSTLFEFRMGLVVLSRLHDYGLF